MTAKEPYSSVLERAYDRFDAAHSARVERSVARRYAALGERWQTRLAADRKTTPFGLVLMSSFAFFVGIGMFIGEWTVTTFGYERKVAMLGFVFGFIAWFIFMFVLVIRAIHRANARAAMTGEAQ